MLRFESKLADIDESNWHLWTGPKRKELTLFVLNSVSWTVLRWTTMKLAGPPKKVMKFSLSAFKACTKLTKSFTQSKTHRKCSTSSQATWELWVGKQQTWVVHIQWWGLVCHCMSTSRARYTHAHRMSKRVSFQRRMSRNEVRSTQYMWFCTSDATWKICNSFKLMNIRSTVAPLFMQCGATWSIVSISFTYTGSYMLGQQRETPASSAERKVTEFVAVTERLGQWPTKASLYLLLAGTHNKKERKRQFRQAKKMSKRPSPSNGSRTSHKDKLGSNWNWKQLRSPKPIHV